MSRRGGVRGDPPDEGSPSATTFEERLEALERTVHELEALEAIYGLHDDEVEEGEGEGEGEEGAAGSGASSSPFSILTPSELRAARSAVSEGGGAGEDADADAAGRGDGWTAPRLEAAIRIHLDDDDAAAADGSSGAAAATLHVAFPPGYPSRAPAVPFVSSADGIGRATRDALTERLASTAREAGEAGTECAMDLVQELTEALCSQRRVGGRRRRLGDDEGDDGCCCPAPSRSSASKRLGRRWIWCHHITDRERLRSIVREARSLSLGGYLHGGYPGIVVVEGSKVSCDEFVSWIKGNKSRPGGFGRNWGHHVRGEIEWTAEVDEGGERDAGRKRKLSEDFHELEDLKALGAACRECGLEGEFLEYVMQHRDRGGSGGED